MISGITVGRTLAGVWLRDDNGLVCPKGHKTRAAAMRCRRKGTKTA